MPVKRRSGRHAAPRGRRWIYIFRSGNFVKVGIAANWSSRLSACKTGTPFEIDKVHCEHVRIDIAAHIERQVHELLADTRHRGEWFTCSAEEAIAAVRASIDDYHPSLSRAIRVVTSTLDSELRGARRQKSLRILVAEPDKNPYKRTQEEPAAAK